MNIQAAADKKIQTAELTLKEKFSGPFLQSPFWASFKSQHGWEHRRFILSSGNECSVLLRKVSIFGSLAYVPMGPSMLGQQGKEWEFLAEAAQELRTVLPRNTFCIRFDPPIEVQSADNRNSRFNSVLRKSRVDIQPPDTVILDLSLDENQLLDNMKQKWRYNIRLAEKKGVTVRSGSIKEIDVFYNLYKETAERDKIAVHSKDYYRSLLELSEKSRDIKVSLFIASHEGVDLAAVIVLFSPYEAVYLYGASSNEKRNLMPAYLLQYHAILAAKKYGSTYYDFYGIPPDDDESHPMHGLYRFKTGFGGRIVHRAGSIDYPYSLCYNLYTAAEQIRSFWFKRLKKVFR